MCVVTKKLEFFEYILHKLIELESREKGISQEEVINELTTVRAMKLLYFFCLSSVNLKSDSTTDIGLFEHFDNFEAYARGPVEVDVYQNRDLLKNFKFENGKLKDKRDNSYSFNYGYYSIEERIL